MKIYEKPMAIVNKFEVTDIIASSALTETETTAYITGVTGVTSDTATQGVRFQW